MAYWYGVSASSGILLPSKRSIHHRPSDSVYGKGGDSRVFTTGTKVSFLRHIGRFLTFMSFKMRTREGMSLSLNEGPTTETAAHHHTMDQEEGPIYSAEQIQVPEDLALIMKLYTKAVIRAQPEDILEWSRQEGSEKLHTIGLIWLHTHHFIFLNYINVNSHEQVRDGLLEDVIMKQLYIYLL
ncbi:radial spoke protein 11 [Planoprotostelium fungivorum]|uniref:Radial spoke protein 11 n=1 Tax=Planoprotostelium fungivorum TaxID=1890364 RepID=A0A2P6MV88_9EUKA|nr:radial spoke protein 11 [Planoprotostelium fungivorum]